MRIDRYELYDVIASGGMATVHLARLVGPAGFGRTVAIKRLHPHLATEAEFVAMLTDEARLASRFAHPNIVPTLDVVASQGELFLVMDYVPGLTLSALMTNAARDGERVPAPIACAIMAGVLRGLDAAHEARDETAGPLEVVHRDVSPQNILVGADGVARLLDFGIAKAVGRLHTTRDGQLKGKLGYMAPEQLGARSVDRRTDIYAASVVLWEALTGERLFDGDDAAAIFGSVMQKKVPAPSSWATDLPAAIDAAVLSGLDREPSRRFARARDMATAIENGAPLARASEIADWVAQVGERELAERAQLVAGIGRPSAVASAFGQTNDSAEGIAVGDALAPAKSKRGALWLTAAVVVSLGAVGIFAMRQGAAKPAAVAAPQPSATETDAPASPVPTADPSAASMEHAPAAVEPTAASRPVTAKPPATSRTGAAARVPAAKARGAKAMLCDPPFTIDEQGHKHYKVDCL
ncbi:MAG TPA: serine/threonine-protein kinase [Polyangiaceae bacterium]|nr:serine/threonine-protein kinase [Polyangiaceae bacterium]